MSNFVPWFFRKYSPIHGIRSIRQGRFYATYFFRTIQGNQGYNKPYNSTLKFGPRTFCTRTFNGYKSLFNNYTVLSNRGVSKLPNFLNFYNIATAKFQYSFCRSWVFSIRFNCSGQPRNFSSSRNHYQQKNRSTAIYIVALVIVVLGGSYAAVPLYRIFCQVRYTPSMCIYLIVTLSRESAATWLTKWVNQNNRRETP